MPDEPMKTFRIRADALFRAHSLFHAMGLLAAYFAAHRRPDTFNVALLTSGTIEVLSTSREAVGPSKELRALRLWHWQQARKAAMAAKDKRASRHSLKEHGDLHGLHTRAVQALNDCFPIGDYAAHDEQLERSQQRTPR